MDTIFAPPLQRPRVSPAELAAIWGDDIADEGDYLSFLDGDRQAALLDLGRLAKLRDDGALLAAVLPRITDPGRRRDLRFSPCQAAGHSLAPE